MAGDLPLQYVWGVTARSRAPSGCRRTWVPVVVGSGAGPSRLLELCAEGRVVLQPVLCPLPSFVFFSICFASTMDCLEPCRQNQNLATQEWGPGAVLHRQQQVGEWATGLPELPGGLSLPPGRPSPLRSTAQMPHSRTVGSCLWGSPPAGSGPRGGSDRDSDRVREWRPSPQTH